MKRGEIRLSYKAGESPMWYHWECSIFVLLVAILCLMNNPLIFAPSSILVPQPPSDAVFDDLLDVLAAELAQGECGLDDDVCGEFLPLAELMLVGLAGVIGVLRVHEVLRQVERRAFPVAGVHPAPASGDLDRHGAWGSVLIDFVPPQHLIMQLFGQFVKRNHET